ncbi:hypothetical protein FMM58_07495 [Campylobacter sp. LR291e]|uniref:glycosyltransferase n=1 Tax=unclassified Campylobacter TaxID=2593542 RepID=UPI00123B4458|nr:MULTISPECIES: glycosyltransferase [unclassified Campylobacter]KAA6228198.1 hypothetical protein FMM55_01065 [Campylobacter sp. LR196d]KAA6229198.1 hypothetical protein FMM58_07495 [Campylobacter sp. LR291e]
MSFAVLMASDENLDFAVANVIVGLKRYNKKDITKIIVMYDGISEQIQRQIESIWPGVVEFRYYGIQDFKKDYPGDIDKIPWPDNKRWGNGYILYAKFYIFELLKEFDSVLWLDSDMLVTRDIFDRALSFDYDMGGGFM